MTRHGHGWGANYRPRLPGRAGPSGEAWSLRFSVGLNVLLLFIVLTAYMRFRAPHGEAVPCVVDHASAEASLGARVLAAEAALQRLQQRAGAAPARRWLTIGIPTVPRARPNTTYLTRTLESLLEELPLDGGDLWADQVRVLVMNNAIGARHEEFEALRARAARDPGAFGLRARRHVRWLDNPGTVCDPAPDLPDPDDLNNPTDRPGRQVRKQTCDLIALLREAAAQSRYYLFMEDDFEVCPLALRALQHAMAAADAGAATRGWVALRVSYGLNGVVLRSGDVLELADYFWEHVTRLPPDLLWAEWVKARSQRSRPGALAGLRRERLPAEPQGDLRPYVVYQHNLMRHLGEISSFAVRPDRPAWPGCFEPMAKAWSLATFERYDRRCLRYSDLSPCTRRGQGPPQARAAARINWRAASEA